MSAKQAHDEAMFKCEYSWGYHGYGYIKALDEAEEALSECFNKVIDERVDYLFSMRDRHEQS